MKLGAPDASGRPQPVSIRGSEFSAIFDALIKAIGEEPDPAMLPSGFMNTLRRKGSTAYLNKLFAGGDLVTGPSTVVQAIAAGGGAASLIKLIPENW